jgi:hypothetical protein
MITYHIVVQVEAGTLIPETAKRVVEVGEKYHTVFALFYVLPYYLQTIKELHSKKHILQL